MEIFNLTLLGEMLTFIVLVWFTMKYIWPVLMRTINDRQKKIADGLQASERGQKSLEIAQQNSIQTINKAKKEAQSIIENATQQVVQIIEHGRAKAKEEGDRLLALARTDVVNEKEKALHELHGQVGSLAVAIAEKVLRSNANAMLNQQMVEQALQEIEKR
jgi:F-type H+-transporting ATPase subunit b